MREKPPQNTKHENTANTTKPENDLKTAYKMSTYIWGRREGLTEKGKVAKAKSAGTQALPLPQPTGGRNRNRARKE